MLLQSWPGAGASSQSSSAATIPSPQAEVQTLGLPEQVKPTSISQYSEQPSPPSGGWPPSSHCSSGSMTPLPHTPAHPESSNVQSVWQVNAPEL